MTDESAGVSLPASEGCDASQGERSVPGSGDPVDEYKECNQNLRHYSNMRFAELTLFFAVNAALLTVVFRDPGPEWFERIGATVAGAFVSAMFGIMNRRRVALWAALHRRAVALEGVLGFSQYSSRPRDGFLSNRNAATALYVLAIVMWMVEFFVRLQGIR